MSTVVIEEKVRVPGSVKDLESFRRWLSSDRFPDRGWISYLNGEVWLDLNMEELAHNQIKGEIASVLASWVKKKRWGKYLHDRFRLIHLRANLSTEPDGMFVSWEALRSGRATLLEGEEGWIELEGTPEMVLEVVSASSVKKDTIKLRKLYGKAEVPEYWLVDARPNRFSFEILHYTSEGYVPSRRQGDWLKSSVFAKEFQLRMENDELGYPDFTLTMR